MERRTPKHKAVLNTGTLKKEGGSPPSKFGSDARNQIRFVYLTMV